MQKWLAIWSQITWNIDSYTIAYKMVRHGMQTDNRHMDMILLGPMECALSCVLQICCVMFFVAEAVTVVCHFTEYSMQNPEIADLEKCMIISIKIK